MTMSLAKRFSIPREHAEVGFGALRRVIEAGGPIDPREREFLAACAETLELDDWQAYPSVNPARAAEVLSSPNARELLVRALIIAACIDTQAATGSVDSVHEFAAALGVKTRWLKTLRHASRRQILRVRMAIYSSSPDAVRLFRRTWREEGLLGVWRAVRFVLGGGLVDPKIAWKYRELGLLPEGTLGRTFWANFTQRKLAFPGERGGLPERMVHHDLMHVLNEYGTDPAGECEVAGFYAAFTSNMKLSDGDPFTFVMTVLTTFHLELPVSPAFVLPARGAFDPRRFLRAFERGAELKVDVMGEWDQWGVMRLPLPEARAQLGLIDAAR
jgi:hypothetical protein